MPSPSRGSGMSRVCEGCTRRARQRQQSTGRRATGCALRGFDEDEKGTLAVADAREAAGPRHLQWPELDVASGRPQTLARELPPENGTVELLARRRVLRWLRPMPWPHPSPRRHRRDWCSHDRANYFAYFLPSEAFSSATVVSLSGFRLCTDMMRSASSFSRSMLSAKTPLPTTGGFGTGSLAGGKLNMSA